MTRRRTTTKELVASIEDILQSGAGNLTPTIDDIILMHKARSGSTIKEATDYVEQHLSSALKSLNEDGGWSWVKVTRKFEAYRGVPEPEEEELARRCVAGIGRASKAWAVHFHVDGSNTCWYWFWARDVGIRSGDGRQAAEIARISRAVDDGSVPATAAVSLIGRTKVESRKDAKRLLRKVQQVLLPPA